MNEAEKFLAGQDAIDKMTTTIKRVVNTIKGMVTGRELALIEPLPEMTFPDQILYGYFYPVTFNRREPSSRGWFIGKELRQGTPILQFVLRGYVGYGYCTHIVIWNGNGVISKEMLGEIHAGLNHLVEGVTSETNYLLDTCSGLKEIMSFAPSERSE